MLLLQLKSDLSMTPTHQMMKTCQEHVQKLQTERGVKEGAHHFPPLHSPRRQTSLMTHRLSFHMWRRASLEIRHSPSTFSCCLSLVTLPSLFFLHTYFLSFPSLALFLPLRLAGTTRVPTESGEAAEGVFERERSGYKPFILCYTWPRQAAGYLGCQKAYTRGGRRDEARGEEGK